MKKKLNSILIIGGTGFIGFNVAKKLSEKYEVLSVSKKFPNKNRKVKKVKYFTCDISNRKKLEIFLNKREKYDYVLNLGGNVNHSNKQQTYKSHFIGSKNLAELLLKKKIKRFIQIGSSVEYGNHSSPHKENLKLNMNNLKSTYGISKFKASKLLIKYFKDYKFPVVILRPYLIYGPFQDYNRIIPIIISSSLKNKRFPCSDGSQSRDFLFIDDFVNLIKKILNKKKDNINGQIFNVGTGKPLLIKVVIKTIVKKIKSGQPVFGKIKLRKDEILKMYPSISKVKRMINWTPRIPFEKGLNKTIVYYAKKLKK